MPDPAPDAMNIFRLVKELLSIERGRPLVGSLGLSEDKQLEIVEALRALEADLKAAQIEAAKERSLSEVHLNAKRNAEADLHEERANRQAEESHLKARLAEVARLLAGETGIIIPEHPNPPTGGGRECGGGGLAAPTGHGKSDQPTHAAANPREAIPPANPAALKAEIERLRDLREREDEHGHSLPNHYPGCVECESDRRRSAETEDCGT